MNPTLLDVAVIVANVFERLGVPYVIGGSLASTIHGEPRFTQDVDFAAAMRHEHAQPFVTELRGPFDVDLADVRSAVSARRLFCTTHVRSGIKVDVHVQPAVGFHASEYERARRVHLRRDMETRVRISSAEDIVLQKLAWYRLGGETSDRQLRDVAGVLKTQAGELDLAYLRRWAVELRVSDLLERALQGARSAGDSAQG